MTTIRTSTRVQALLPLLALAQAGHAALPTYDTVELQARSNLIVNDDGWNVPPGTSFNSISPAIDDARRVAFTAGLVPIDGNLSHNGAGLWFGGHAEGGFVKIHDPGDDPEATMIIADTPSINASGEVAYYTSLDGGTYQLWKYDPAAGASAPVNLLPLTPSSIGNPGITDAGRIGFKGRFGLGYGIAAVGAGPATLYAWDTSVDEGSDYAYIYSPATAADGRIVVKVSTVDYDHNEIRVFDADGSSTRVVADAATSTGSPFAAFDNGLDVGAGGAVAVIVRLAEGNLRAVYRFDPDGAGGYAATEIARVGAPGPITELAQFAPAVNASGLVAFRARDADGEAIYVGNGEELLRVVGKGDLVATDLGGAQIGQHDSSPVFSGKPALNANGDVAFVAGVHPAGNPGEEWGTGVFVAYATQAIDDVIFVDGFEAPPAR